MNICWALYKKSSCLVFCVQAQQILFCLNVDFIQNAQTALSARSAAVTGTTRPGWCACITLKFGSASRLFHIICLPKAYSKHLGIILFSSALNIKCRIAANSQFIWKDYILNFKKCQDRAASHAKSDLEFNDTEVTRSSQSPHKS